MSGWERPGPHCFRIIALDRWTSTSTDGLEPKISQISDEKIQELLPINFLYGISLYPLDHHNFWWVERPALDT